MIFTIFDLESDGLLDDVTKVHCISYQRINYDGIVLSRGSITDKEEMKKFFLEEEVLVGHNIIRYDLPVVNKVLDIKFSGEYIDTLTLSWYLFPERIKHGLEMWGEDLGVPKPEINDWENLSIEEYIHRCEEDVEINVRLFVKQLDYLKLLYYSDRIEIFNLINYLNFKLDCAREQEEYRLKIDKESIYQSLEELMVVKEEKTNALIQAMPKKINFKTVVRPSKPFKKDGSVSKTGERWFSLLEERGLPEDYDGEINVIASEEDGKPSSPAQLKDWLYLLGWTPRIFEHRANKAGEIKAIPQIYNDDKEVCDSIKELYPIEPALENLDMLSLTNHRIGVFNSFLNSMNDKDEVIAGVAGLTNTLRFKHTKPIANLPNVRKFYGKQIRGAIITHGEDFLLCGSDMSSLEDTTKQHYMYFFDPEYVVQMRVPGFDPHIDIAVLANFITQKEADFYKEYNKLKDLNPKHEFSKEDLDLAFKIVSARNIAKRVNFAGIYGAGPPKIAQSTGMPLVQAQKLHKTYWERNKAVKLVSKYVKFKTVEFDGVEQMWLFNPISQFWYSLRYEKDIFSTLNQG